MPTHLRPSLRPSLRPALAAALALPLLATVTVGVLGAAPASAVVDYSGVKINEVESNGDLVGDWIELTNVAATAVDVSGMKLLDNDNAHTFVVVAPSTTLAPGGYVSVYVDTPQQTPGFGLGSADTARLYAPDATSGTAATVDSYQWTAHATTTYGRCPNGTGAFVTTLGPTRGGANSCTATAADLRINEIESSDGANRDWVEITNVGATTVNAGGLIVKDNDDTHSLAIPAGTTISAGGYYALDVDDSAVTGSFGLGQPDSARLFLANGSTLVDSYTWTAHAATTYGRCPNGTGAFTTTGSATKGAANDCSTAPGGGIVFNEVESNADPIGDFAELANTSASPVDISGYKFTDSEPERVGHIYSIPEGTVVPAGGYFVLAEAAYGFGLGVPDAVRLLLPDGTTLVADYAWTQHATTTYGRCPDKSGPIVTTTASTRGAANDCRPPIKINEIESNGGTPGDWVELINNGTAPVDVSGFVFKDDDNTHAAPIAAGTTIAAGAYLVLDETTSFGFGLGQPDAARLYAADGTTLIDSYSWTTHATTTYGRCPNGLGDFATTQVPTKGAVNSCPGDIVAGPWPGGSTVTTVDPQNTFTSNLSGLMYEPSGTSAPGTIWAVKNGPGTLYKLVKSGQTWAPAAGEWATGKALTYPNGTGDVDAEGVTFTNAGPGGGMYVASERNNAANTVSRPAIERYDVAGAGPLAATRDYNLTADLPGLGANLGLEAIAWIPDSFLTARGFKDETTGAAYAPATYPGHGDGLFLVGVEATGRIYAYALDQGSNSYTRVASFASGFVSVMELHFEKETQKLWVVCDDTCQGRSAKFDINAGGVFVADSYVERPSGMPNLNNEGFTLAPRAECVAGAKPAFWADDSSTGGYALRAGTINCTPLAAQTVTITSTPSAPTVGGTYLVTATNGASGNPVTFSTVTPAGCSVAGSTVSFVHSGTCSVRADQAGNADHLAGFAIQDVVVAKGAQTVSFTSTPPAAAVVGQTYAVTATGGASGNPVVVVSSTPTVCSVNGGTVTLIAPGTCVLTGTQAGDADYFADSAGQSVTIAKAATTMALSVNPSDLVAKVVVVAPGAAPITGDVTFLVDGQTLGTARVVDGVATLAAVLAPGSTRTVYAVYPGSDLLRLSQATAQRADPTITAEVSSSEPPSAAGWYSTTVTITFTCAPDGSPLAQECPVPVAVDTSGADQSVIRSVTAKDGGVGTVTVDDLDVDLEAPEVRIGAVEPGTTYRGAEPTPRCLGKDPISGVASCTLTIARSGLVVTVTATAVDAADNTAAAVVRYRVPAIQVLGARYVDGQYVVERGTGFRVKALLDGTPTPRLVGPVRQSDALTGSGTAMTAGDAEGGLVAWTHSTKVPGSSSGKQWKIGILSNGTITTVLLKVRAETSD